MELFYNSLENHPILVSFRSLEASNPHLFYWSAHFLKKNDRAIGFLENQVVWYLLLPLYLRLTYRFETVHKKLE